MSLRVVFFGTSSSYSLVPLHKIAATHRVVAIVESGKRHCHASHLSAPEKLVETIYTFAGQPSLWGYARRYHLPYYYFCSGHETALAAFLKTLTPDVGCIASFNQLLPKSIFQIPRLGMINFHPSLLPKYRGPNVWFWLYHEMELESGATIHFIDEKEDHGDILKQDAFSIPLGMPPQELLRQTIKLGSQMLPAALTELENGTAQPVPQPQISYPQRGRYLRTGEQLFPWREWEIENAYHFLAGVYPWYQAFNGQYGLPGYLPWKAISYQKQPLPNAGKIRVDRHGVYFAHHQGKVRLQLSISKARFTFWCILAAMLIITWLLRLSTQFR